MLEDEETQKKGITVVGYNAGHGLDGQVDKKLFAGFAALTGASPIRLAGLHLCYSSAMFGAVMAVIMGVAQKEVRVRTKLHQGKITLASIFSEIMIVKTHNILLFQFLRIAPGMPLRIDGLRNP